MSDEYPLSDTGHADVERYKAACHAMQSGVMAKMNLGTSKETAPKQLRVGVNSALVETGAIVKLLIDKGIIDGLDEWFSVVADAMEREVKMYEEELSSQGLTIHLA